MITDDRRPAPTVSEAVAHVLDDVFRICRDAVDGERRLAVALAHAAAPVLDVPGRVGGRIVGRAERLSATVLARRRRPEPQPELEVGGALVVTELEVPGEERYDSEHLGALVTAEADTDADVPLDVDDLEDLDALGDLEDLDDLDDLDDSEDGREGDDVPDIQDAPELPDVAEVDAVEGDAEESDADESDAVEVDAADLDDSELDLPGRDTEPVTVEPAGDESGGEAGDEAGEVVEARADGPVRRRAGESRRSSGGTRPARRSSSGRPAKARVESGTSPNGREARH